MSGQQAVTAAAQIGGAIIGAEFGAPSIGAALGSLAGAYIGGALFNDDAPREARPQVGDQRVQTSQFGGAVPVLFGRYRYAGNVIWCSDIRTIVTTTEVEPEGGQGGKGGAPTQTVEQTEYKMDLAIALGEGEVTEIEKMYANGVLIYDASVDAMPAGIYLREAWADSIVFYTGTETQLPDPTIEAAVGVGNASAYRGTAYVVMTNLNLTTLKTSTLPNFEFIVVRGGTLRRFHCKLDAIPTYFHYAHAAVGGVHGTPNTGFPVVRLKGGVIRISSLTTSDFYISADGVPSSAGGQEQKVELWSLGGVFLGLDVRDEFEALLPPWRTWDDSNPLPGVDLYYGVWEMGDGTGVYATSVGGNPLDFEYWFGSPYGPNRLSDALPLMASSPKPRMTWAPCADGAHGLVVLFSGTSGSSQNGFYWYLVEWRGLDGGFAIANEGACGPNVNAFVNFNGVPHGSDLTTCGGFLESDLRHAWTVNANHAVHSYWINDSNELVWLADFKNASPGVPVYQTAQISAFGGVASSTAGIYADQGVCVAAVDEMLSIFTRDTEVVTAEVPLSAVVEELCVRAGIPATEVDATNLDAGDSPAPMSTTVYGFMVAKSMTARAAIEALRPGYFFDVVDSEKVKFVLRGAVATETFERIDLGAGEDDAANSEVESGFSQPTELPARVNIRYVSIDGDLQWGVQTARRETTTSVELLDGEVPCVFYDAQAWQIAENNLRDIWASAGKRRFSTGLKYAKHEPTDVVFVDDGDDVRQVRITRRADRGCMIEWEAEDIDALMYESRASQIEFSIPAPTQPLSPGAPTNAEALDLPPLTELKSGNEVAVYVAASPFGQTARWAGAHILVSRDAGVSFGALTHVPVPSPMGVTLSAPRSFAGGNIFDTTSRVRVFLDYGTLQSATEAEVLNGANGAVIGDEIVQFCGVTQIDSNVYELTRFLRGRKGTEWAVSGHATSERFVFLSTRLRDIPLDIGDRYSATMFLRAYGTGSASRYGTTERFETQFARLMPYSPVHLFAVRHPTGEWTLRWNRRDRYMNDWNSGVDVPLSEADEVYEVEVYNVGGDLIETYRAVESSAITVPADVLGGSPTPSSITFKVYQMSEIVGRGFVGSKTITQAL